MRIPGPPQEDRGNNEVWPPSGSQTIILIDGIHMPAGNSLNMMTDYSGMLIVQENKYYPGQLNQS
ncbi:hypothetical protein [Citrobacter arsenatis]|uniref:hypothetical protein n=1 Tax=Citrobacter arsenatis TaxID=2546350 RepID=UPI00300DC107